MTNNINTKTLPLSQGKHTIIDADNYEWLNQWKWYYDKGYAVRNETVFVNGVRKQKRITLSRLILNAPKDMEVDHINGDSINNTKANLRLVTDGQNARNKRKVKNKSSVYKGVSLHKGERRWHSRIMFDWKLIHLGSFEDEVNAALAYNQAALKYHGEYAKLNIIEENAF
jgi:hypothetical protein